VHDLGEMRNLGSSIATLARRHQRAVGVTVALVLFVVAGTLWILRAGAEQRALVKMPPEERRSLYEQTLRTTEMLCTPPQRDAALRDRCEDLATFLGAFPECDSTCASLVSSLSSHPVR
jgi:hypothetical protein